MKVIGLAAQAQMGKDTTADRIHSQLSDWGFVRSAFALKVKETFCDTFGVTMEFVEKWKVVNEPPPGFSMTVRKALQFIGDGFRQIQPNIWLDLAFRDRKDKILSDVRYVNEFVRVKEEGGLNILIGRPDRLNDDSNGSEAQIRPFVEWCLVYLPPDRKFVNLANKEISAVEGKADWETVSQALTYEKWWMPNAITPPPGLSKFDVFIRNDGTVDDLHKVVDAQLVPFIKEYAYKHWR